MNKGLVWLAASVAVLSCGGREPADAAGSGGSSGAAAGSGGSSGSGGAAGSSGAAAGSGGSPAGGSAGAAADAATVPVGQKFLFEAHYTNYAWGSVNRGYYITADGNVYTSDRFAAATIDGGLIGGDYSHDMTEEQIVAHHGTGATLTTTIAPDALRAKVALIGAARQGELVDMSLCRDFGRVVYVGFDYAPATGRYDAILLGADGDTATLNTAPEAQGLVDWLAGVGRPDAVSVRSCAYLPFRCSGQPCADAGTCRPDLVPAAMAGSVCLNECSVASNCDSVASCSVCAAVKQSCVVDKQNRAHCGPFGTCGADLSCACVGDAVCAGGVKLCSGTASTGFSCAPR
jgi:hypothetical protein